MPVFAMGNDTPFAFAKLAFAPDAVSVGEDTFHAALHLYLGNSGNNKWDVLYTNLASHHWKYLPLVLRSGP